MVELLQRMHLSQYQQAVVKEEVSGAVLSEFSDEDLKDELGVTHKTHCVRLLQFFNGHVSAATL